MLNLLLNTLRDLLPVGRMDGTAVVPGVPFRISAEVSSAGSGWDLRRRSGQGDRQHGHRRQGDQRPIAVAERLLRASGGIAEAGVPESRDRVRSAAYDFGPEALPGVLPRVADESWARKTRRMGEP